MKYDIDYFIKKFESIPSNKWGIKHYVDLDEKRCVIGHCMTGLNHFGTENMESKAIRKIFMDGVNVAVTVINDGLTIYSQKQTPKERIIEVLHYIKNKKVATKYVCVTKDILEDIKDLSLS